MLYMQEVEKMEGYGQESYQAKASSHVALIPDSSNTVEDCILCVWILSPQIMF